MILRQTLAEQRPAVWLQSFDRDSERFARSNYCQELTRSRNGSVDEFAPQHSVRLHCERQNDHRIFGALRLMDRRRVG